MSNIKSVCVDTLELTHVLRYAVGFERVFADLGRTAGTLTANNYPPYNIIKLSDTLYAIEVAVAGFSESELNAEVVANELVISGQSDAKDISKIEYLHHGIAARNFVRRFALADNVEVRSAIVKNGILTVNLEHIIQESAIPKRIAITFQP